MILESESFFPFLEKFPCTSSNCNVSVSITINMSTRLPCTFIYSMRILQYSNCKVMHGLLYFLWVSHLFWKFQNAIFQRYFHFLPCGNCNSSRTTPRNFGKKISTILGACRPQSLNIKGGAADAQVVLWPLFCHFIIDLC